MSRKKSQQVDLEHLPGCPGAYLMKDARGAVLYVGTARNLRARVRSHFSAPASRFVPEVSEVEYIAAENAGEALLLEYNLIKKHRPRYNIRLRDDKRYPYIKLTLAETYPRAYLTRTLKEDGSYYFGPYPDVKAARLVLAAVKEIFPYRGCKYASKQFPLPRPCIDYEMKRCVGPCVAAVSVEEYRELCQEVARFLRGRHADVRRRIASKMQSASQRTVYEKAATYRDILQAMDTLEQRQIISTLDRSGGYEKQNEDYLGLSCYGDVTAMVVLKKRGGRVVSSEFYFLDGAREEAGNTSGEEATYEAFVPQYYDRVSALPQRILLPVKLKMRKPLEALLAGRAGHRVQLLCPLRGARRQTLAMAQQNAALRAEEQFRKMHGVKGKLEPAVEQLQRLLGLSKPPLRIEGYDISNIAGTDAVGSMAVLQAGRPYRGGYRRFRIKRVEGTDDYAMMQEMLRRRLDRREDERFGAWPDAVLIDGGRGHLSAAAKVFQQADAPGTALLSLAKQEEKIFMLDREEPIQLPERSPLLQMLQRLRDEAHRFAITYHRSLRSKKISTSVLEQVEGLGRRRKQLLIRHFGSVEAIGAATEGEIAAVRGISPRLAGRVKKHLQKVMIG